MDSASSLFIHHDPSSQPWVNPYFDRRVYVLSGFRAICVTGKAMYEAFEAARGYFGVHGDEYPQHTIMSDWIRCHQLLTVPRLLYSDSDVLWISSPDLGDEPLKGDTTFGVMWSGSGLSKAAHSHAFQFARNTGMMRNINSNFLIPINKMLDSRCFLHCKPTDSKLDLMSIARQREL